MGLDGPWSYPKHKHATPTRCAAGSNPGRGKNILRCGKKNMFLWFQGLRPVCFDCFVPIFFKFFKFIKVGSICFPMLPLWFVFLHSSIYQNPSNHLNHPSKKKQLHPPWNLSTTTHHGDLNQKKTSQAPPWPWTFRIKRLRRLFLGDGLRFDWRFGWTLL